MMTRLYDTFMLHDELDMLEIRLAELDPYVHRFVLVEAPFTFHGDPKPLHYAENAGRFAPWKDKICHLVAGDRSAGADPWAVEHAQRDAALLGLEDAADGDVVLISDVDEFPPRRFLQPDPSVHTRQDLGADPAVAFRQQVCLFAVDWLYPYLELCTVAARAGHVRTRGLAAVRDGRGRYPQIIGGWHFTWLGGTEAQRAKLALTCHSEIRGASAERIADGTCYRDGIREDGQRLVPVDVTAAWPQRIAERQCPPSWFRPR